ncbi:GMC family oxidoreductase [Sphingomonas profundi]|uniref:GMC family oxidoreductase n=1 Tax=Alterirhizorhabdus profundi TaxID=2681549 RepID=UPI0012E7080D|nr:GMC family oxidoreductase N-terminal domain-containing protein [Sphingomonas profundi]
MQINRPRGDFDYVIVGGGSAGCVLANRLSADPRNRVLLLEAGGEDDWLWIHVPVGYLYCMGNPRTDWGFRTEPEPGLNGRALNYPRGRVLGGSSSINGMIYMRGQARDYDGWRQAGNVGWAWDDVLPWFRRSENHFGGEDAHHGAGGEWHVAEQRLRWDILDAFRDAAEAAGIPKIDDFNRGDNEGSGYFRVNQRGGWRWSSAKAFLRPALNRPNLTVETHAVVQRVTIADGRATGILYAKDGATWLARAGEVVLAAGAVGSPAILEHSGIGDGDRLRALGIAPLLHLAGVGENLQDHLQIRCAYKVSDVPTLNMRAGTWLGKALIGLEYALFRKGPMSMAPSQLGLFARSNARVETANLQYHVQPLSLDSFGEALHAFPAFTASVCNLRPESRGSIHVGDPDPAVPPAIRPNYLSAEADRIVAAESIELTRRIVAQRPLARYRPEEFRPGVEIQGSEALARAAGDIATTIFHPVGTARMGTDDAAVVDPELRVRGVAGLRVIDASVMPTITSGNTNSPTIMIAEKGADMILKARLA